MEKTINQSPIKLEELPIQSLVQLKNDLDKETQFIQEAIISMQKSRAKLQDSEGSIEQFKDVKSGDEIMVPLSTSLYVPGKVVNNDKFMVDLGTGYYAEMNRQNSLDFVQRKIKALSDKIDESTGFIKSKVILQSMIVQTLQAKQAAAIAPQK